MISMNMLPASLKKSVVPSWVQHKTMHQGVAWIALLCYAVLLLHMVLVHTADVISQSHMQVSKVAHTLAWLEERGGASQPDCPVCHVGGSHQQIASGSGPGLYGIQPVIQLIAFFSSAQQSQTHVIYSSRAPPVG
jgi:hypothetical protein